MATLGLTKLGAVNRMFWWVNQFSVSALDTGGTSDAAKMEEFLDQITLNILAQGLAFNTQRSKSYTPAGSPYKITLASTVLAVRGAGNCAHRQFDAISGFAFDIDRYSNEYPDATVVMLDVMSNVAAWDDIPPAAKEYIAWCAARGYQQCNKGSPQHDEWLRQHCENASRAARPIRVLPGDEPMGVQPYVPGSPQQQQQQR